MWALRSGFILAIFVAATALGCRSQPAAEAAMTSSLPPLPTRTPSPGGSFVKGVLQPETPGGELVRQIEVYEAHHPLTSHILQPLLHVNVDADGRFTAGPLEPGFYSVKSRFWPKPGEAAAELSLFRHGGAPFYCIVMLGENETLDLGVITVAQDGVILKGRVVDTTGHPVVGARVFPADDLGRIFHYYRPSKPCYESTTDGDGRFILRGMLADEGYVFAEKAGYHFAGTLAAPGTAEAVITLCPEGQRAPWADRYRGVGPSLTAAQKEALGSRIVRALDEGSDLHWPLWALAHWDPKRAV